MNSPKLLALVAAICGTASLLPAQTLYTPSGTIGASSNSFVGVGTPTPGFPFTVITGSTVTAAQFVGNTTATDTGTYIMSKNPTIGFNEYWNGSAHVFGQTGVNSYYGARIELEPTTGVMDFRISTAPGTAGSALTVGTPLKLFPDKTAYFDGSVGIGTSGPTASLEVAANGTSTFRAGVSNNAANTVAQVRSSLAVVGANSSAQAVSGAVSYDYYNDGSASSWSGVLLSHYGPAAAGTNYGLPVAKRGSLIFQNVSAGVVASNGAPIYISPNSQLTATFLANGNVGIGTTNPTQKLSVNGTIRAKEVIVDTGWSDYVFAPGYRLAPLSEVEQHIKAEQHLPGIPSAAEVAEHGVTVGEMQAKLLAKIEELTLHVIEQEKAIEALKAENTGLHAQVTALADRR